MTDHDEEPEDEDTRDPDRQWDGRGDREAVERKAPQMSYSGPIPRIDPGPTVEHRENFWMRLLRMSDGKWGIEVGQAGGHPLPLLASYMEPSRDAAVAWLGSVLTAAPVASLAPRPDPVHGIDDVSF